MYKFDIAVYKCTVLVTFDKEEFQKKAGYQIDENVAGCVDRDLLMVWLPTVDSGLNVADTAHEAFHVADFIADKVGLHVQEGTGNEHMAYLVGHIVHKIFDCLDKENAKKN